MKPLLIGAAFCAALIGTPAVAGPVLDAAGASSLIGATVTVTRFGGALSSATFVDDGASGAVATAVGSDGFTLAVSPGDTASATWTLTNTDASLIYLNLITAVKIDFTLSGVALFDDDSVPSTPDSGAGLDGIVHVGGASIASADELLPWADPANLGDMYRATSITFGAPLGAGAMSAWQDDTDVIAIDAPPTLALFAAALGLLGLRRRR